MAVSSQQSRDAALLRATTELFVLDKTHDQAGIRRFEELAAHFLTKVSPADRAFVAERLARHPDTPGSVLRMLGKDLAEIASPILRHSPSLNSFDLLAILAATGPTHYRLIASRGDLAPDIVSALRRTGDAETIGLLPPATEAEPEAALPAQTEPELAAPALVMPVFEFIEPTHAPVEAATAEPERQVLPEPLEAAPIAAEPANHPTTAKPMETLSSFAAARVLTASLSAEMTALATEAPLQPGLLRRTIEPLPRLSSPESKPVPAKAEAAPAPILPTLAPVEVAAAPPAEPVAPPVPEPVTAEAVAPLHPTDAFLRLDRTERLALLQSLSTTPVVMPKLSSTTIDNAFRIALGRARLTMLARQRQRDSLIRALAEGLRLDTDHVTALLDDASGEALVILLRAIGLADSEAQQVLLVANPVMREALDTFFRLTELLAGVPQPVADRLVGSWRGDAAPETTATHQPHFADANRKDARPAAAERGHGQEQPMRTGNVA